jgi:hypothetical protein
MATVPDPIRTARENEGAGCDGASPSAPPAPEFDDVTFPFPGYSSSPKAAREILRLATRYGLRVTDHGKRSDYSGSVNGQAICVSVYDRDVIADLAALRRAIEQAEACAIEDRPLTDILASLGISHRRDDHTPSDHCHSLFAPDSSLIGRYDARAAFEKLDELSAIANARRKP